VNALIGSEAVMNAVIIIIVCCVAVATCKLLPSAEIKRGKKKRVGAWRHCTMTAAVVVVDY
jgi:hypothetical protein